jgi:hypothetical protein
MIADAMRYGIDPDSVTNIVAFVLDQPEDKTLASLRLALRHNRSKEGIKL